MEKILLFLNSRFYSNSLPVLMVRRARIGDVFPLSRAAESLQSGRRGE
jgi:hypothetical protein